MSSSIVNLEIEMSVNFVKNFICMSYDKIQYIIQIPVLKNPFCVEIGIFMNYNFLQYWWFQ